MDKSENFDNEDNEFGVILDPREQRRRLSLAIKERLENFSNVITNHMVNLSDFSSQFYRERQLESFPKFFYAIYRWNPRNRTIRSSNFSNIFDGTFEPQIFLFAWIKKYLGFNLSSEALLWRVSKPWLDWLRPPFYKHQIENLPWSLIFKKIPSYTLRPLAFYCILVWNLLYIKDNGTFNVIVGHTIQVIVVMYWEFIICYDLLRRKILLILIVIITIRQMSQIITHNR